MPLRREITLDRFHDRSTGRLPALIGVRFTGVTDNRVDAELVIRDELLVS